MKIEIWSDMVCPFCYIGKKKLDQALDQFSQKEKVEIEFKSYQLDPNTPPYSGQDFYEGVSAKFGGSVEQSRKMMASIAEQGKSEGLDLRFDTMKPTNTFDAHRLTQFAKTCGKDAAVAEKLFYANFTESKDIGNIDTLAEIAEESGLNKEGTLAILLDKQAYAKEVHADIEEARQIGVTSVPFFLFNRKYTLSGAQPTEAFVQALNKILEEEKLVPAFESLSTNHEADAACGDDGCAVPDQKG